MLQRQRDVGHYETYSDKLYSCTVSYVMQLACRLTRQDGVANALRRAIWCLLTVLQN